MTFALEDRKKKRYEVLVREGDNKFTIVSNTTKDELLEFVNYMEKVCPKCYHQVDVQRIDNKNCKYSCKRCNRTYVLGNDYHFINWEEWMEKEKK